MNGGFGLNQQGEQPWGRNHALASRLKHPHARRCCTCLQDLNVTLTVP